MLTFIITWMTRVLNTLVMFLNTSFCIIFVITLVRGISCLFSLPSCSLSYLHRLQWYWPPSLRYSFCLIRLLFHYLSHKTHYRYNINFQHVSLTFLHVDFLNHIDYRVLNTFMNVCMHVSYDYFLYYLCRHIGYMYIIHLLQQKIY